MSNTDRPSNVRIEKILRELADAADAISIDFFHRQNELTIEQKSDGSFVTTADKAVETKLREILKSEFPQHSVHGEEEGLVSGGDGRYSWIIDPIDGTHGFMRGMPIWATLIAFVDREKVIGSMVSAPALATRWWAGEGTGAYKSFSGGDSELIKVSAIDTIAETQLLYTGYSASKNRWQGFSNLLDSAWRERGVGDFWGHCLVAEGVADGMLDPIVSVWDVAALDLLVREAGGAMTNSQGSPTYADGHVISSNGIVHQRILTELLAG